MKLAANAIKTAKQYVQIDHYARQQYRVRHYDENMRAWWEGNITNRETAFRTLHETRIRTALEAAGIEDAGAIANVTTYDNYPADWRALVREIIARTQT
jgi:hypothetical protein